MNFKNVKKLHDEDYLDIPCPKQEVLLHESLTAAQLGLTVGTLILGPTLAFLLKNKVSTAEAFRFSGVTGFGFGAAIGFTGSAYCLYRQPKSAYDWALSLRKDPVKFERDRIMLLG